MFYNLKVRLTPIEEAILRRMAEQDNATMELEAIRLIEAEANGESLQNVVHVQAAQIERQDATTRRRSLLLWNQLQ